MAEARLIALYPYPSDVEQFERDYQAHLRLLREKLQLPEGVKPYSVTRFVEIPVGKPAFYQMFIMTFPSAEALQEGLSNPAMVELAEDACVFLLAGRQ